MDTPVTGDSHQEVTLSRTQIKFYASEECQRAEEVLRALMDDPAYETDSGYFITTSLNFSDRHLEYLSKNPLVNVTGYLSNLKLMTRKR